MKVIFITREGYQLPGARVRCYNFARQLFQRGLAAEVLSFADTLGAKDGARESQMGVREKIKYNWIAFKRLAREKDSIFCVQRFNYHSFAPYLAHLLNRNKIILDLDDWEMREDPGYYLGFYPRSKAHFFTRLIARKSVFCVAASSFLKEFLLQFNKRVYYIPSGVDTELFKPSSNGLSKEKVIFSWIGTFHRQEYIENIRFVLECFSILRKRHDGIYFDIVGDGIYRELLVRDIEKIGDPHIRLKGWIVPEKVPEYLADIHIGLLPVARETKFNLAKSPTKLFEYMSMSKPVVASRIGEAALIINDGQSGYLADNKEQFIDRMRALIEDQGLRRRIGERAREAVVREYSQDILGSQLYAMFIKRDV